MSDNLKLVQYFVESCQSDKIEKSGNLISPDFKYVLNLNDYFDWEQFVTRSKLLHHSSNIVIHEITSEDDVHFCYDFDVTLPEPNLGIAIQGFIQIIVIGRLITRLDVHTNDGKENFEVFQELRKNSKTILL